MISKFKNTKYEALGEVLFRRDEIRNTKSKSGFSLTEVLLALGTLAVGMLFIAAVFPASINLTTIASERTISATVADEAFAKIRLYGLLPFTDPNWSVVGITPLERVSQIPYEEYGYPSTPTTDPNSKRYWWSALCNRISINEVQVTVFISRKIGASPNYYDRDASNAITYAVRPVPVKISVTPAGTVDELQIADLTERTFVNDGYTIVENSTGHIYRVLERYANNNAVIKLDQPWQGGAFVWVVPQSANGGRYPCIAVYQKVIRF